MSQRYVTEFYLEGSVNDFDAARDYLYEDDMTKYLPNDIRPLIIHVSWGLAHRDSGYVIVDAKEELSEDVLDELSRWIRGQNSDGLGEGFEQQDFAWCTDDYGESWMCSFDWRTNKYPLIKIEDASDYCKEYVEIYCGELI